MANYTEIKRQFERCYVGKVILSETFDEAWWWDICAEYYTA